MTLKKNNPNDITHLRLSIQVSLSGLSFCILNQDSNTIELLRNFEYNKKLNPVDVVDKLQHHFNTLSDLNQPFQEVLVIHENELATIVPKALFNEDNSADYLKFNNKILSTDFIAHDAIDSHDSVNVYVPYVNINNFLYDKFGAFTYKHSASILIDKILNIEKHTETPKMYVNVALNHFEVVVVNGGQLLLYNSFEYQTKEDFIYYILFVVEQMNLNPEALELILLGAISLEDSLYNIAYKYIRYVSFGKRMDNFKFAEAEQSVSNHDNFVILNSF